MLISLPSLILKDKGQGYLEQVFKKKTKKNLFRPSQVALLVNNTPASAGDLRDSG